MGLDNIVEMRPIQTFAGSVLAEIVRRQPPSPARTAFAWQLAVGPALARATSVEMEGTTLQVRAHDERWLKEIARAKPIILPKLQQLLGDQNLTRINVVGPTARPV
jgi:predicted nucleic acid-binding Zn ribbon protein